MANQFSPKPDVIHAQDNRQICAESFGIEKKVSTIKCWKDGAISSADNLETCGIGKCFLVVR